jgi:NDP-sugar pyrophosphorylase family protein
VVLAAGVGRRFGGDKQLVPLGPAGELLSDYSVRDALRHGASRAVFVIRRELESEFREHHARWAGQVDVRYVHQNEPTGTTPAVLTAQASIEDRCVVLNADDYYGPEAIAAAGAATGATVISYRLGDTLSAAGGVTRAFLETDPHGWLRRITEVHDVTAGGPASSDQPVSMNCWALPLEVFPLLRKDLELFRRSHPAQAECALPETIGRLVARGELRVKVVPAGRQWIGVTHASDVPVAQAALRQLARNRLTADS